jgi:prepilin-type N-terminal cleavage/methylation domain-containing protein
MRGYTLIEVIIVVSIIAFLSMIGITKFNELRKDVVLNQAVDEFVSQVKSARSMSMTGLVNEGESFADDGLPSYGVSVSGSTYDLFRDYKLPDGTVVTNDSEETYELDTTINITGSSQVKFSRISGDTIGANFIFEKSDVSEKRQINIGADGVISITKI